MKPYKVLQMPVRNAKGGITQYVLRSFALMDKNRFMFDWVTLDKTLSFEEHLVGQGCAVHHLSCRQEDDEARFRAEMTAILAGGYDAVHLHTSFWRGFLAEELAAQARVPKIIVHAHSTGIDNARASERERLLGNHEEWKKRFTAGMATHFAACSKSAADFLFGEHIPRDKITILRNGIDTRRFEYNEESRRIIRRRLGIEGQFVLLQSGRLEYQKNYDFTLELFADYITLNPNAVLLIAGSGGMENALMRKAEPLGRAVRFLGFRRDIPELLSCADVFLQPSHFEGFSIASIEAQASGIPWLVSEAVPEAALPLHKAALPLHKAALPLHKAALPLHKAAWVDMLVKIQKNPRRNINAGEQLRGLGWDIHDSVKELERLYGG